MEGAISTINKAQAQLEKHLAELSLLDYDTIITPACTELIKALGDVSRWPIRKDCAIIDIYRECLFYRWIFKHDLTDELLTLLMIYRPIVYHLVSITKTESELSVWKASIRKQIDDLYGEQISNERVQAMREILDLGDEEIDVSAITYFHYFIGMEWSEQFVGIDKETLEKTIGDRDSLLHINITYKLPFHDKRCYVYRPTNIVFAKTLLSSDNVRAFQPIVEKEIKVPPTSRTTLEGKVGARNYAAIDYSNGYYSLLSKNNEPMIFTANEIERLKEGALPVYEFNVNDLHAYAINEFNKSLPRLVAGEPIDKDELMDGSKIYAECIRPILDRYDEMTYERLAQFAKEVERAIGERMKPEEKAIFIFYISNYDIGVWNKNVFISYIWSYFEPEDFN